jgi:hypothetical protein
MAELRKHNGICYICERPIYGKIENHPCVPSNLDGRVQWMFGNLRYAMERGAPVQAPVIPKVSTSETSEQDGDSQDTSTDSQ